MKKTIFIFTLLMLSYTQASAIVCSELENDKIEQVKRAESAKLRIFEQENTFTESVNLKKLITVNTVSSSTQKRIEDIESIITELESLKNQSKGIRNTVTTLTGAVGDYATKTAAVLKSFDASVLEITSDRTKSIKNTIAQYENDLLQIYVKSASECGDNSFTEDAFDTNMKNIRKRVIDSQKNTRRMTQGIDAVYAKMNIELDEIDASLNKKLKSVRPILKRELSLTGAPLSFLRLIRTL